MKKYNQYGKGYYPDLNSNIAGLPGIGSYREGNAPIFAGELIKDIQFGGNILDKKIYHLQKYIKSKGNYKLPKYVLNDL